MTRTKWILWVWIAALVPGSLPSAAQTATGTLHGRVVDSTGAVVPGAKVVVENQRTGSRQELTTNAEGVFVQPFLPPSEYRVTVEKSGFEKSVTNDVRINVEQNVGLELPLKVGNVSTAVEVSANVAQLATESATFATTIGGKAISQLPLNGRNPYSLATIVPGVVPGGGGSTPWISGGRNATNDILIDGTSIILPENNVSNLQTGWTPVLDSVEEFSVITNSLEARYGRTGGGVFNVATKSGTNTYHISLYDYLRNSALDTNTWAGNRNGTPLASFQRNQFGGTAGGPVWLPRYKGKDKTFFFLSWQSERQRSASQSNATVPLQSWIDGDFSSLRNGAGGPIVIYDPLTDTTGANRVAFPNNRIPTARMDPVAVKLLTYFPKPNATPTNVNTQANNFFVSGKAVSENSKFDSRLDHVFNSKFRMFARGSYQVGVSIPLNGFGNAGTSIGDGPNNFNLYNITAQGIYTLNANTIVNLNYGFTRNVGVRYPFSEGINPTATLGLPSYYVAQAAKDNLEFPRIDIGSLSSLGQATFTTLLNRPSSHIIRGDVSKALSKHTLMVGAEWRKLFHNFTQHGQPSGQFGFNAGFTQRVYNVTQGGNATTPGEGFGLASFLLGMSSGGSMSHSLASAEESSFAGFYAQDTWKVTPTLTVTLGLRWDADIPRTERYNRLTYFDIDAVSPLQGKVAASACPNCGNLRGAMMFTNPDHRRQTATDLTNWGPRLGIAWHPMEKWVFRTAYGMLYSPSVMQAAGTSGTSGFEGYTGSTSMLATNDSGRTPFYFLRNPFPDGFNLPPGPTGLYGGAGTNIGGGVGDSVFVDSRSPVIQQWNFNVQRELKGWLFDVGYLGSKGQHLIDGEGGVPFNQLPASFLSLGNALNDIVPNPFFNVITNPTSSLRLATTTRRQTLVSYPQYTSLQYFRKPQGNSLYHSLIFSAEKRLSKGLQMLFSFTGGKLIDDVSQVVTFLGAAGTKQDAYCRKCDRSVSAQDQSRRLVVSANYELPFGRGKTFFSGTAKVVDLVIGGWQINGIATFAKGLPIALSNGGNNVGLGNPGGTPRASSTGHSGAKSGAIADRLNAYFDTTAYSMTPNFTFGTVGRFLPDVRSPGTHNLDFSMFKNFRVTERLNIEYRAEAYNFTNSPTWNGPNTNVSNSPAGVGGFGWITTANGQRVMQMSLRLSY